MFKKVWLCDWCGVDLGYDPQGINLHEMPQQLAIAFLELENAPTKGCYAHLCSNCLWHAANGLRSAKGTFSSESA